MNVNDAWCLCCSEFCELSSEYCYSAIVATETTTNDCGYSTAVAQLYSKDHFADYSRKSVNSGTTHSTPSRGRFKGCCVERKFLESTARNLVGSTLEICYFLYLIFSRNLHLILEGSQFLQQCNEGQQRLQYMQVLRLMMSTSGHHWHVNILYLWTGLRGKKLLLIHAVQGCYTGVVLHYEEEKWKLTTHVLNEISIGYHEQAWFQH